MKTASKHLLLKKQAIDCIGLDEKAVLMNPNTTRARIERFVRSLDPD